MTAETTWKLRVKNADGEISELGPRVGMGPLDQAAMALTRYHWLGTVTAVDIVIVEAVFGCCSWHGSSSCPCAPYHTIDKEVWSWSRPGASS